jgi:hypothetical protein
VTAAVAVRLAHEGRLILDDPLDGQLDPELLDRWPLVGALCRELRNVNQLMSEKGHPASRR